MNYSVTRITALIFVFLLSQTAGVVHAGIHPFHDHDHHFDHDHDHESVPEAVCKAFELVENQSSGLVSPMADKPVVSKYIQNKILSICSSELIFQSGYLTRAPPLSF